VGELSDTAIIICSRPDSKRVPGKIFTEFPLGKYETITMLGALLYRLKMTDIPIILAIPEGTKNQYEMYDDVHIFEGSYSDPLKRMSDAATEYSVENIVRVCHDKVFIDQKLIIRGVQIFKNMEVDYLFSSFFIEGTGFEVIKGSIIHMASAMYRDVEHISYAVKSITKNVFNWATPSSERASFRLLADTYKDIEVLQYIFKRFKTKTLTTDIKKIIDFLLIHPEISSINSTPELTIYTCCYNSEKYLAECIDSVVAQKKFNEWEYIIIDDASTDMTSQIIAGYTAKHSNIRTMRNKKNIGLSSSSNIALSNANGRYITRIDSDDYYTSRTSCKELVNCIFHSGTEAIYPANFFGSKDEIQGPEENHHIGGAIFNRRSMNDIKFTDGLRGYEGLDFFHRARNFLKIGYLNSPVFLYRQHNNSMSKEAKTKRSKIKKGIMNGLRKKMA